MYPVGPDVSAATEGCVDLYLVGPAAMLATTHMSHVLTIWSFVQASEAGQIKNTQNGSVVVVD
jgi:hypothetical protein